MVSSINRGHRMFAHLDLYGIAAMQDATIPSIKGDTGIGTRIVGNIKAQYDGVGKNHAAKTQHMRTDGCNENARYGGVDDRTTGGHTVGSGPCGTVDRESACVRKRWSNSSYASIIVPIATAWTKHRQIHARKQILTWQK